MCSLLKTLGKVYSEMILTPKGVGVGRLTASFIDIPARIGPQL